MKSVALLFAALALSACDLDSGSVAVPLGQNDDGSAASSATSSSTDSKALISYDLQGEVHGTSVNAGTVTIDGGADILYVMDLGLVLHITAPDTGAPVSIGEIDTCSLALADSPTFAGCKDEVDEFGGNGLGSFNFPEGCSTDELLVWNLTCTFTKDWTGATVTGEVLADETRVVSEERVNLVMPTAASPQ